MRGSESCADVETRWCDVGRVFLVEKMNRSSIDHFCHRQRLISNHIFQNLFLTGWPGNFQLIGRLALTQPKGGGQFDLREVAAGWRNVSMHDLVANSQFQLGSQRIPV